MVQLGPLNGDGAVTVSKAADPSSARRARRAPVCLGGGFFVCGNAEPGRSQRMTGRTINLSRRAALKGAGAALTVAAAKAAFPAGAFAQGAGPETRAVKLGYIALTDASPLIVAKEKGLFAKHGLADAEVLKQASWGATRDNIVLGSEANGIDGAHILSPMPYLMTAGRITQGGAPMPMYVLARLNLDAQAISVSNEYRNLKIGSDAAPLKEAFARKRQQGGDPKVAMTFPGGTHDLWIRYWLAAGGIDPDKDVSLITVPPPQMVANMKVGTMDC